MALSAATGRGRAWITWALILLLAAFVAAIGAANPVNGVAYGEDRAGLTGGASSIHGIDTPTVADSGFGSVSGSGPSSAGFREGPDSSSIAHPVVKDASGPEELGGGEVLPQAGTDVTDRLALIALYVATGGPGWTKKDNWLGRAPLTDWHGVETNSDGRVTEIDLPNNGLKGNIPQSLGGSSAGQFSVLPFLERVNFEDNQLSGSIPRQLGQLTSIRTLLLAGNQLTGPIPDEMADLVNLRSLSLGRGNKFTECIPPALTTIPDSDLSELNMPVCGAAPPEPFARVAALDFTGLTGEGAQPEGIWSDGAVMWVSWPSSDGGPGRLYAYDLASTARVPSRDFDLLSDPDNGAPEALWGNATTLWVGDAGDGKLYAYNRSNGSRLPSEDFNVLGDPSHRSLTPRGLWADGVTLWQAESGGHKIFAYNLADKSRDPANDFNTLGAAGNENPEGIWSDGQVMWVADLQDNKLYAYGLQSKQRIPSLDFNSLGADGVHNVGGIWSDGQTMWVLDNLDRTVYAYRMPAEYTPPAEEPDQPENAADRKVLEQLYNTTGGNAWTNRDKWMSSEPIGTWEGVKTNEEGRVVSLALSSNGLTGTIPLDLGQLEALETLFLSFNQLRGLIPPTLGELKNLERLNLGSNNLRGPIPAELGDLKNLRLLHLQNNQLGNLSGLPRLGGASYSSSIPSELGQLTNLERLYLNNNQLTGRIPAKLGDLSSLKVMNLSENSLRGSLPPELGKLTSLESLILNDNLLDGGIPFQWGGFTSLTSIRVINLSNNRLGEAIPWQLGNRSTLTHLYLRNNNLEGGIPVTGSVEGSTSGLERLNRLKVLDLGENDLDGAIAAEIAGMRSLEVLYLDGNGLTGRIPPNWSNSLKRLVLSGNQLNGSIPAGLNSLTGLTHLYLDQNRLTSSIPSLRNLTLLTELSLWSNDLTGGIPSWLGSLTRLQKLSLSKNELSGPIPTQLGNLHSLKALYLNVNQLEGTIPEEFASLYSIEELYLHNNNLTGCVPRFLEGVKGIDRALKPGQGNAFKGFCLTEQQQTEKDILLKLYFSTTEGDGWTNDNHWVTNPDIGTWAGVKTDSEGFVTELNLAENNLTGRIPWELAALERLEVLNLSGNELTGRIPKELGYDRNLRNLTRLDLYGNDFYGCVPLGERFRNHLNESTDREVASYSRAGWQELLVQTLKFLGLGKEKIAERPGVSVFKAAKLALLSDEEIEKKSQRWSDIRNGVPLDRTSVGFRETIKKIKVKNHIFNVLSILTSDWLKRAVNQWISPNYGVGLPPCAPPPESPPKIEPENQTLETDRETLLSIRDHLRSNGSYHAALDSWEGEIEENGRSRWEGVVVDDPASDGVLRVTELDLSGYATIDAFGRSVRIKHYYGWGLKGSIPTQLGSLGQLKSLNLSKNELSGRIPSELGHLGNLKRLALNQNFSPKSAPCYENCASENSSINGNIPGELGNLEKVTHLSFSGNPHLEGDFPHEIGNLVNLEYLYVRDLPKLTGCIPPNLRGRFTTPILVDLVGDVIAMLIIVYVEKVVPFAVTVLDAFNSAMDQDADSFGSVLKDIVKFPLKLITKPTAALSDLGSLSLTCE